MVCKRTPDFSAFCGKFNNHERIKCSSESLTVNTVDSFSHRIVLVNLNEFSSIFWKVQHSHSQHQKTTSNLCRITLKGTLRFSNGQPLEGAMYIHLWQNSQGHPENVFFFFLQISQNMNGFRQIIHKAFRIHRTL